MNRAEYLPSIDLPSWEDHESIKNMCRLANLKRREAKIIILHYEKGYNLTELAKHEKVSITTISRTLKKAHEKLKRKGKDRLLK